MKGDPLWKQLLPHVYRMYEWQPRKVTKVRGVFRVQVGQDVFALKPVKAEANRLAFLHRMNSHLQEHHFPHVLPWLKTKYGDAFYIGKAMSFYAVPWFGKEWSRNTSISEEALIQSLADMHRFSENIEEGEKEGDPSTFDQTVKQWNEQMKQLESYEEEARKREYASPFDVAFLACHDELRQAASFALNGLKRMSEIDAEKPFRRVYCHRRAHRHNLVIDGANWKWIDFAHAGLDVPMRDCAAFIHRFPPQGEDKIASLEKRLDAYEETFPLSRRERQLLCLFLAYPKPVVRWLNRYYKDKRSHDEMFYVQGMENALQYFKVLKGFVKQIWPQGHNAASK